MHEMQEKLKVHMPPPGDIRKCSLALSNSIFKDDLKEIFETVMDFEGNIIDYSLKEMIINLKAES
jgi:acetolactate synthase small subunit